MPKIKPSEYEEDINNFY